MVLDCASLTSVTIHGNARTPDSTLFTADMHATVDYDAGTSGWGSTFDDIPAVMLDAPSSAGSLQVTILPAGAITAGAQWQVDGGIPQPSGATVLGLSPTNYSVSFTAVCGCTKPANPRVLITGGNTNHLVGAYSEATRPVRSLHLCHVQPHRANVGSHGHRFP